MISMSKIVANTVKISELLNPLILNDEWVHFQGDSEYYNNDGDLKMGYWSFLGLSDDEPTENDWNLEDEIPEEAIYDDKYHFKVINAKGNVCVVQFHYYKGDEEDAR